MSTPADCSGHGWEGIQTEPKRLADGPNRAQRRAAKRKTTRNAKDGREEALKAGRRTMRDPKPANSSERDARARR